MESSHISQLDGKPEIIMAKANVPAGREVPAFTEESNKMESNEDEQEQENDYPKGIKFILLTIALYLAVFIMALDNTIISTAVPEITSRFHSIDDIGWYTAAYLLPLMSLQPTFGKIYSFFKIKPIFLGAMAAFEVGSILCAAAPSSAVFILGRVISGIGAAAIYAGGMVIITSAVPLNRISVYLAGFSSMWAIANSAGPPLGGVFTDSKALTWRFCFWINLPFGFAAIMAFLLIFNEPRRPSSQLTYKQLWAQMDLGGTVLFVSCIVLLFIALQLGGNEFSWADSRVIVCFVLSGVSLIAFVFLQRFLKERATIPPHIFLNRSVVASVMVAALMSLSVTTHTFYLPFYFQSAKGTSASGSGLRLIPYTISVTVAELIVGTGSSFLGVFLPFMYAGTSLFTVAAGLLLTIKIDTTTARLVGYQILAGAGIGSSMQLCATSVRAAVADGDIPIAATLSVFAPFFGASMGAAIAQNVFRIVLKEQLLRFLPEDETIAVIEAGGTAIGRVTNPQTLGAVKEAYRFALSRVFIIPVAAGGVAFIGALCIKWRTLKSKARPSVEGERAEDVGEKRG